VGKPARTAPTITARRDGSLYSSHRTRPTAYDVARGLNPPALPTLAALELHGKQVTRTNNRSTRRKGHRR
jgi:hypothetical protein